jgi:hypothetical protein
MYDRSTNIFQVQMTLVRQGKRQVWEDIESHKDFFDWLAKELGISNKEDWEKISKSAVEERGGSALLDRYYGGSVKRALATVYEDPTFLQQRLLKPLSDQREYLDWLGAQLNIGKKQEWYRITKSQLIEKGGGALLTLYGNCVSKVLQHVYPELGLLPWKFETVAAGFWNNLKNHRDYFEWLRKELAIQRPQDWYHFKISDLNDTGGRALITRYYANSLAKAVTSVFPEFSWQMWR